MKTNGYIHPPHPPQATLYLTVVLHKAGPAPDRVRKVDFVEFVDMLLNILVGGETTRPEALVGPDISRRRTRALHALA